ncbi:AAA family ATPase [bacterium]|nr:AAA family ATPase [bacterium]
MLIEQFSEYVRACFAGIWIETFEPDEALREIAELCDRESWSVATWDIERGLSGHGSFADSTSVGTTDPVAAVQSVSALASDDGVGILVLHGFHRLLGSLEVIQAMSRQITLGKQNRTFLVVLAPVLQIPVELEKQFVVIQHELPDRDQLRTIATEVATEDGELPSGEMFDRVLDSAAGLTRYEAEGAFSLSLVRHGRIEPDVIWSLKSQTLRKSGLLGLHRGGERFDQLGGLENLKAFSLRALRHRRVSASCRPRGVLLLSPPGCGKSAFAKSLGNETGRPTLTLDFGAMMGSLVGESERNMRQALRIADAMAPCILFCDELDKGLSGVGSATGDSGVCSRVFGSFLTWLNDHTSDVFVVATCNDISRLPPELVRAERFDGVFFVDLPDRAQREAIWNIHLAAFQLDADQPRPSDEGWTGAEIRSCCRLASLLDVPIAQAATNVVPVTATAADAVERLRQWASGRCLSADRAGIYRPETSKRVHRRSVTPSSN